MTEKLTTSARVATNIINTYGMDKFLFLVNQFSIGASGPSISAEFGVTRQRVNQWKRRLGIESVSYTLHPEVEQLLAGGVTTSTRSII